MVGPQTVGIQGGIRVIAKSSL